jgi:hypothetical protein
MEELELYNEKEQQKEYIDKKAMRVKFRLLGPLSKGHNIVVYIRGSLSKTAQFVQLAGKLVPIDNRTKWNSWYKMLNVLLLLRPHIEAYCLVHEEELEDDILSFKEWKGSFVRSGTSFTSLYEQLSLLRETLRLLIVRSLQWTY